MHGQTITANQAPVVSDIGQMLEQAINATKSLDHKKIAEWRVREGERSRPASPETGLQRMPSAVGVRRECSAGIRCRP